MSNTKFFFSEVLTECINQGTDAVVNQLISIQQHKQQLQQEISESHQDNNNQLEDIQMNESSSSNEYHSNDEKQFQLSSDNESDISYTNEQQQPSPKSQNKHIIDISLHVQSLVKDTRINCNFPSNTKTNNNNNTNNNSNHNKKLIFGNHLKRDEYNRYLPSTFQSSILYHIEWQRKLIGHRIGLIIMATAMGKTILAIFDIEKELNNIHNTLGIEYGLTHQMKQNQNIINEFICPCIIHNHIENKLNIKLPSTLDRITYPTYLSNTIKNNKHKYKPTEITSFKLCFIVHTKAIRNSAYFKFKQHFQSIYNNLPSKYFIRVEPNTSFKDIECAKFIFILFQSFDKLKQQNGKILSNITHIIVDEVHHLLADTWIDVHKCIISPHICPSLQYYLGMTATLSHRTDVSGDKLKSLFSNIVYINFPWTIAKQLSFFPSVEYLEALPTLAHGRDRKTYAQYLNEFEINLNRNNNKSNHFSSKALNRFIYNLENSLKILKLKNDKDIRRMLTPQYIVKILLQYQTMRLTSNQELKKKILIFANDANTATNIAKLCNVNGLKAGAVHYKVAANECENIFNRFRNGNLNVLVNVNVVNEGYDLPSVDCVVMARLTSSEIIFVQQLGRGLRKDPNNINKQICILDLALNLRRRWKVLQDIISDQQIIEFILNFWCVSNFVGTAITMSPAK
eukprot:281772_1